VPSVEIVRRANSRSLMNVRKGRIGAGQIVGAYRFRSGLWLLPAFFVTSLPNLPSRRFCIRLEAVDLPWERNGAEALPALTEIEASTVLIAIAV
jgi:hypothetical protein